MGKISSLKQLAAAGLNTPLLLVELPQILSRGDKLSMWKLWAATGYKDGSLPTNISIRTTRDGEYKTPHFPNLPYSLVEKKVNELAQEGYGIYLFKGIDPRDCAMRGTLVYPRDTIDTGYIDLLVGPGTVRDMEKVAATSFPVGRHHKLEAGLAKHKIKQPAFVYYELMHILEEYREKHFFHNILEWSIYHNPVGQLNQKRIYWELRPWS